MNVSRTTLPVLLAIAMAVMLFSPGVAQAQGPSLTTSGPGARAPYAPSARIPVTGKQFDAFTSTDYYNFTQDFFNPANPDIAVGPDDILVVAGSSKIARLPNPNSFGAQLNLGFSATNDPTVNFNALRTANLTSEVFLDTWLGQTALDRMCPGQYNPRTCLIQNPAVRYDQMQGKFLVAFTVIDTGVRGVDNIVTQPRRATWVLLISRFATFTGINGLQTAPGTTTQVFTPAITAGGVNTGGQNANWTIYYGGTTDSGNFLDMNRYTTHTGDPTAGAPAYTPASPPFPAGSAAFTPSDCRVGAVPAAPIASNATAAATDPVCLFPTETRIGIDNDFVMLVSPVVNVNKTLSGSNAILGTTGPYWGNRVRILAKRTIYNSAAVNGNTPIADSNNPPAFVVPNPAIPYATPVRDEWDIFRVPPPVSAQDPTYLTYPRYTIGMETVFSTGAAAPVLGNGLVFEPAHLRGRTLASYSNYPFNGTTHLIGAILRSGPGIGTPNLFAQQIRYRADLAPSIVGQAALSWGTPDDVRPAQLVPQNNSCFSTPCSPATAPLFVGDNRPRRVIAREGHYYDARTGMDQPYGNNLVTAGAGPILSTVFYDVAQLLPSVGAPGPAMPALGAPGANITSPSPVLYTKWQNGHFYAPMFDVPANVLQAGAVSPVNQIAYFEKLFVGTTSPRFAFPSVGSQGNIWPSLFDVRQGLDRFDQSVSVRDPLTGQYRDPFIPANQQTIAWSARGGAGTDPNFGGLWVYGAFAAKRLAGNVGEWATNGAYYDMSFNDIDAYGTDGVFYSDVCADPNNAACYTPFFVYIQTARNAGLDQFLNNPPAPNTAIHGAFGTKPAFGPNLTTLRKEMAAFIINSQMDPAAIFDYLDKTPGGRTSSFADVPNPVATCSGGLNTTIRDVATCKIDSTITPNQAAAIEVMYRRGYTRGCGLTNDGTLAFCPNDETTRGQMAVFMIRSKMGNVYPTVYSGCPTVGVPTCGVGNPTGDAFGIFVNPTPYFPDDTPATHAFFVYIQKLRELRITNGISATAYGSSLAFPPPANAKLTRGQMATFIVRAFFF